jgi:hypothetical protein
MERALHAEDPKFASTLRGADLRAHQRRRVVVGSLGLLVGLGLLLAGVSVGWLLGVVGFLVMLTAAWWITSGWRAGSAPSAVAGPKGRVRAPKPTKNASGVMDRFEDRWRRRREGNDS